MTSLVRAALLLTCGAMYGTFAVTAVAAEPGQKADVIYSEALSGKVSLPPSDGGALMMAPCYTCSPVSFQATPRTIYYLTKTPVTLQELKSAIGTEQSMILTVAYNRSSGELVSIVAPIAPPPAAKRR